MVSAGRDSVTHPGMLEQLWKNAGHSQNVFDFSTEGMNQHSLAAFYAGNTGGVWGAVGVSLGREHGNCFGSCVVIQNP